MNIPHIENLNKKFILSRMLHHLSVALLFSLAVCLSISCKSIKPSSNPTDSSKLKLVMDDNYVLKLTEAPGGQGGQAEPLYYFETCYKDELIDAGDASSCTDAIVLRSADENGRVRVHFTKDALSDLQSQKIHREFGDLIQDPDKAAAFGATTGAGTAVAVPASKAIGKPFKVVVVNPEDSPHHLTTVINDLSADPHYASSTLGEVKQSVQNQADRIKKIGLDPTTIDLGSKTRREATERLTQLIKRKGHIFSDQFADIVQTVRIPNDNHLKYFLSLQGAAGPDKDLAKFLMHFMKETNEVNQSFDIKIILDKSIADDYVKYTKLNHEFGYRYPDTEELRATLLKVDDQKKHSFTFLSDKKGASRFKALVDDLAFFQKSWGIPKPVEEGLNALSRRVNYGMLSWTPHIDHLRIRSVDNYIKGSKAKKGFLILKDLLSSRLSVGITMVAASAAAGSYVVRAMEQANPKQNLVLKYPSLLDTDPSSQEEVSDIFPVLDDLRQLVQSSMMPPLRTCVPASRLMLTQVLVKDPDRQKQIIKCNPGRSGL